MFHVKQSASCTLERMALWQDVVCDGWRAGQRISAVGPGPVEVHLDHATRLAALIRPDAGLGLDLGTGAGIPGLALAGLRPDMRWILLDASMRRLRVVESVIERLGWSERVRAVHGRAEDGRRLAIPSADIVTARLFGVPATTAECAAPLVAVGGQVLVSEPPDGAADHHTRWPDEELRVLGLRRGPRFEDPPVQVLDAIGSIEARFPRKAGVSRRRPLW